MSTKQKTFIMYYIKSILESQGFINFKSISKNTSYSSLTRFMNKEFQWQTHLWTFFIQYLDLSKAYLVLDDTILEKPYSEASNNIGDFIRYCYSNKDKKIVKGINVVLLLLVIGDIRIPLAIKIYDKSKTKTELALELFSYVRNKLGLKSIFVLFDSWYSSKDILKRINDYGWYFVCRVKANRAISGRQAQTIFSTPYGSLIGYLKGSVRVLFVRYRTHYYITNRLSLRIKDVRVWYSRRSIIEEINKVLKYFGFESCQSRKRACWYNHLYLVIISFCFLEGRRHHTGATIYKLKSGFKIGDYKLIFRKWERFLKKC